MSTQGFPHAISFIWCSLLEVTTVDHSGPSHPILCISCNTNQLHVLPHHTHKLLFWPSSLSPKLQHLQFCCLQIYLLSFVNVMASILYIVTPVFPLTLVDTPQSQTSPVNLPHPLYPASTLFFSPLPQSPLLWTLVPKYENSSAFIKHLAAALCLAPPDLHSSLP